MIIDPTEMESYHVKSNNTTNPWRIILLTWTQWINTIGKTISLENNGILDFAKPILFGYQ